MTGNRKPIDPIDPADDGRQDEPTRFATKDAVLRSVDVLGQHIDRKFDGVHQRIDRLEASVDQRFDGVDQRFDGVDQRFDRLEGTVMEHHVVNQQNFMLLLSKFNTLESLFRDLLTRLGKD